MKPQKKPQNKGRIIWQPQPRQVAFMERPENEVLYGGAAGGGKSDALVMEALRQVNNPMYRGIIFRDTVPQLEALIEKTMNYYRRTFPGAKYNHTEKRWSFPSGAKIFFGYMQSDQDRFNYQGRSYAYIAFDELTHFSKVQYDYLKSRNRADGPGLRCYVRATCNPDGKGMLWVKERFITPAPPMTRIWEKTKINLPDGKILEMNRSRMFVPATVFDNQELLKNDPEYLATLAALPEAERNALLYGDWDSFDGQVFREWTDDPDHYIDRKWTHVIEPFEIPEHWRIYRGFDHGYARPFSVGWYAVDTQGKIYRIKEWYGCTGEPNQGIKIDPVAIAAGIRKEENEDPMLRGKTIRGIADPAIFDESRGESVARMMEHEPNRIFFEAGDHTRIAGKMQFHYRLAFDEKGECMFQVFNTCRNFIRTIPGLVYSETHPEDIDTDGEDHIYDECRYVMMENPISPRKAAVRTRRGFDPLDQRVERNQRYAGYCA